jgi:hypothetical protein
MRRYTSGVHLYPFLWRGLKGILKYSLKTNLPELVVFIFLATAGVT